MGGRAPLTARWAAPTSVCGKMADSDRLGFNHTGDLFALPKQNGEPVAKRQRIDFPQGGQPLYGEKEGRAGVSAELGLLGEGEACAEGAGTAHNDSSPLPGLLGEQRHPAVQDEEQPINGEQAEQDVHYGGGERAWLLSAQMGLCGGAPFMSTGGTLYV